LAELSQQTIAEFGGPQTGPQRGTKTGAPGCSKACHKLASGSPQGKVRFAHLQVRLKQQLLRSKDGNGNCSCRDSDVVLPVRAGLPSPHHTFTIFTSIVTTSNNVQTLGPLAHLLHLFEHNRLILTLLILVRNSMCSDYLKFTVRARVELFFHVMQTT
jgi:hypothetical protein